MQRDIDDARVSTKLIPYLFDESASGLIKLFPPIVVVVIPTDNNGLPADTYPPVEESTQKDAGYDWRVVRSGEVGKEAFEVKQLLVEVSPASYEVTGMVIFERSGARMDFLLSNVRENFIAPDGQFQFTAAPGLTVKRAQ